MIFLLFSKKRKLDEMTPVGFVFSLSLSYSNSVSIAAVLENEQVIICQMRTKETTRGGVDEKKKKNSHRPLSHFFLFSQGHRA